MIEKLKQITFPISQVLDNKRFALYITVYDRPEFFSKTVESLNNCEELENVPIFVYLDGGPKAKQKELIELIKKIKWKHKYAITRPVNYGCNRNVLNGFNDLFLELNFDYVLYLEEDYVLSKNYFKYCFEQYKNIKENIDPNIGIFQGYGQCFMTKEEKKKHKDEIMCVDDIFNWGYMFERGTYIKIKSILHEFYDIVETFATNGTALQSMLNRKIEFANAYDKIIEKYNDTIPEKVKKLYYKKQIEHCNLTYDGAFDLAMAAAGLKRYCPVVNRMINIGRYGTHLTEAFYKHIKIDQITLDEVWLDD